MGNASGVDVAAVAGGVAGGVAATLLIGTLLLFVLRLRSERQAAANKEAAHVWESHHRGGGVTAHVGVAGVPAKARVARLAAEDRGYSSSPRFPLTPRMRAGSMV
jgi:hypothetical protein